MLPCTCSALARYSSFPQIQSVHVLALQLAQPVENAWCNETTMLKTTRHRQTAYIILYTSSAGGPVMRWLEASITTQAVYKTPGTREKRVRRKYTRDGVDMRSMSDPGEYLIVQCLCLEFSMVVPTMSEVPGDTHVGFPTGMASNEVRTILKDPATVRM